MRWAAAELGGATLGDKRRTDRLVQLAAAVAESPGGTVTQVLGSSAGREGAYRLLENDEVEPVEIARAATHACLERTKGLPYFFAPLDGSSLTLTERKGTRGLGPIGDSTVASRGIEAMSTIGVSPDGTPLGYCGQQYWVRPNKPVRIPAHRRSIKEKETRHWLNAMDFLEGERASVPGSATPWYQLDRGGDFKELFDWTVGKVSFVTVRAASNRRLADKHARLLWDELQIAPLLGHYTLEIQPSRTRKPRVAKLSVRAKTVTLRLMDRRTSSITEVPVQAVFIREVQTAPEGETPIEWLLLTNHGVKDFEEARLVIYGYSMRWRIEEFHRTWKTTCGIEQAQLRSLGAMERWATTLSVVAMRIQRLTYLARTAPDLPASVEFAEDEIESLIVLKKPGKRKTDFMPSIGQAVGWIAELGGYTGKSSGRPPGAQVLGRGLVKLSGATEMLVCLKEQGKA